jgi:hypothetical protein
VIVAWKSSSFGTIRAIGSKLFSAEAKTLASEAKFYRLKNSVERVSRRGAIEH